MERCHICDESVDQMKNDTYVVLDGREYPLCPVHGTQMADYLVTMLQGWLHDGIQPSSRRKEPAPLPSSLTADRPVKTPEKGKR